MNILENVPSSLREPITGNVDAILSAVIPQYAGDASVDDVIHFIAGAIRNQKRIVINKDGNPLEVDKSNSFKAVVKRVEIIERKGEQNFLLGKKATIHLEAKNAKGDLESQTIDTEWIEFHGGRKEDEVFSVALANTLVDIAEANIGKEVIVRKGFITGVTTSQGGSSVRYCANIQPIGGNSGGGGTSSASSSSSNSKPLTSNEDVADFIEDIKGDKSDRELFEDLNDKQQKEIPRIVLSGLAAGNPAAYLTKVLESADIKVSRDDLDDALAHKDKEFELFRLIAEAAIG